MLQYSKYDTTPLSNLRALRVRVGQTSFSLLSSDGILKTMSEDKLVYFLYLISFTSGTYSNFSSTETFLYGIKYSNSTLEHNPRQTRLPLLLCCRKLWFSPDSCSAEMNDASHVI